MEKRETRMSEVFQVAICDDDSKCQIHMKELLTEYFMDKYIIYQINLFSSSEVLIQVIEEQKEFDVVFLGASFGGFTGLELGKKIRDYDQEVDIVYMTKVKECSFEGYKVNAFGYLLKEHLDDMFYSCMDNLLQRYKERTESIWNFIKSSKKVVPEEVMYIESKSHQLLFYTHNLEEYRLYRSLDEVEEQVKNDNFIRIHKSFLINMEYVDRIRNYKVYLKNGMTFNISRDRYPAAKMNYESYVGRGKKKL